MGGASGSLHSLRIAFDLQAGGHLSLLPPASQACHVLAADPACLPAPQAYEWSLHNTELPLSVAQVLYRAAKARFDEDEEFKTRSREAVTQLQGGNPEYLKVPLGLLLRMCRPPPASALMQLSEPPAAPGMFSSCQMWPFRYTTLRP